MDNNKLVRQIEIIKKIIMRTIFTLIYPVILLCTVAVALCGAIMALFYTFFYILKHGYKDIIKSSKFIEYWKDEL